jgi:8-oxo-dGTP pyrophosphatase MutT (NUDIX family)
MQTGASLTRAAIRSRLAAAGTPGTRRSPVGPGVGKDEAPGRGDHDLNPGFRPAGEPVPAAVLVPIIDRPKGLSVLLTVRAAHLSDHAGQIAFPGGRIEPGDAGAPDTALREAFEEVSLEPAAIEVAGRLDTYLTRTGYAVVPIVGLIAGDVAPRADPSEVAEIFEVPLDFLIDPAHHERRSRMVEGRLRFFYAVPFGRHFIWGATAGMIVNLSEILARPIPDDQ